MSGLECMAKKGYVLYELVFDTSQIRASVSCALRTNSDPYLLKPRFSNLDLFQHYRYVHLHLAFFNAESAQEICSKYRSRKQYQVAPLS